MVLDKIRKISRNIKDNKDRKTLGNKNFTIFASNCIGGVIYHNLGHKFLSPTINLWIKPNDYIKMLENPHKYFVSDKMIEVKNSGLPYPVGSINGVKIYGQHYDSFKQLKDKWDQRSKRINWDNIDVFFIERDGATKSNLLDFDKLPYNKVVFTKKNYSDVKSSLVIPKSYDNEHNEVNNLCDNLNRFTGLKYIDKFDYVNFFNNNEIKLNK